MKMQKVTLNRNGQKRAANKSVPVRPVESPDKRKADEISAQYGVLSAKANDFLREAIKFGSLLVAWEQFLGKSGGGRTAAGEGLKGWLEQHCPEINYNTAFKYKLLAEKNAQMLGGGAMALAALQGETSVTQPDGEVIDVEAKIIEKRDEIFAEANSFSKLEQMWFDMFGPVEKEKKKGKAGRPKGSKAKYDGYPAEALQPAAAARALWSKVIEPALKETGLSAAAKMLGAQDVADALAVLEPLVSILKERKAELK